MRFNLDLDEIRYIKLLYKDSEDRPCVTKAAIKHIDSHEIFACSRFEEELNIVTPQEITLSIVCNDGLYRTKTVLKSAENDEPYAFFAMEIPQGLEYQQNREFFRVNANYDCTYIYDADESVININTKTYDLSANGVSILVKNHPVTVSNGVINLAIDAKEIQTKVRYVRSEKVQDGYKISFTFTNIKEQDRDLISQACIRKQLEQRRNSIH